MTVLKLVSGSIGTTRRLTLFLSDQIWLPLGRKEYVWLAKVFDDSDTLRCGRKKEIQFEEHNLRGRSEHGNGRDVKFTYTKAVHVGFGMVSRTPFP